MRRYSLILLALLVVFFTLASAVIAWPQTKSSRAPAPKSRPLTQDQKDDQRAIEMLHEKDIRYNAADDLDGISSLWTEDVVTLPPNAAPVVGREASLEYFKNSRKQNPTEEILSFDEQWNEIRISGDWAWEWGTISSRVRPASTENREVQLNYKVVRVLQRQPDGSWLIARSIWNNAALQESKAAAPEEKKPAQPRSLDR
ncbi:MAG TPA: DUF4440 domain-containing protein [Terriglobales bacterium]|nr:DUF4440 domain-containing protein [Terriglobales bacterium]